MKPTTCPDEATLQKLLTGHLSGPQADDLEVHLSTCDICVATAAQLSGAGESGDDLVQAIRSGGTDMESDAAASRLIQRLKAMHADSINTQLDDTQNVNSPPPVHEQTLELVEDQRTPAGELSFLDPPEADDEIGRLGRFRVMEILGRGGMGVVLRAEDPHLKRDVAIKVLNIARVDRSEASARFLREAQATAAIDHDNIVTIHDVGEQRGMPYYAMQFLRGESLHARLARQTKLPIADAVRIAREIAQGLSAAHAKGLLHRDIKPANVWLEEGTDRAKIVDFGLARLDDHDDTELTNSGAILGTPKYMSPEQAQGQAVDQRCDLFSLGSVLFHLVAGEAPFSGANVTATLIAVATAAPPDVQTLAPKCPDALKTIIDRLLEKSPDDRFAGADEVVEALAAVEDELSVAPPPVAETILPDASASGRSGKPLMWIALAAALPLLILLSVIFLWRTPHGTLRVEVDDPNLEVFIDGDQLHLTDKSWEGKKKAGKRRLRIKVGDQELKIGPETVFTVGEGQRKHRLSVQLNKSQLSSDEFEVTRDQETVLSIALLDVPEKIAPGVELGAADGTQTLGRTPADTASSTIADDRTVDADDGWVDILPIIDVEADSEEGGWQRDDRGVVRVEQDASTLRVPVEIHGNYELRTKFLRDDEEESGQGLILPIGPPPYTVHPQFFSFGDYHGLSVIRGHRITSSRNPTKRKLARKPGHEYEAMLKVVVSENDAVEITCHLDGEEFYMFKGLLKDLSPTSPDWLHNHIALRSGAIPGARWTSLELRMLDGHAKLLRSSAQVHLELVTSKTANIHEPRYSFDGKQLVGLNWSSGQVEVREATTGNLVRLSEPTRLIDGTAYPTCSDASPANHLFAVANNKGVVSVVNYETGKVVFTSTTSANHISSLRFSPDGKRLYIADRTALIRYWEVGQAEGWQELLKDRPSFLWLAVSPDSKSVAYADFRGMHLVDASSGDVIWANNTPIPEPRLVTFTSDGSQLAVFCRVYAEKRCSVRLYDSASGKLVRELPLPGETPVRTARFLRNDSLLLLAHEDDRVCLVNSKTGKVLKTILGSGRLDVSADEQYAITLGAGEPLRIWRITASKTSSMQTTSESQMPVVQPVDLRLNREIAKLGWGAKMLAVSPDGKTAVVAVKDGIFQWWDLTGEQEPKTTELPVNVNIWSAEFTPDGKRLFVDPRHGGDGALYIYNATTHELVAERNSMMRFAISPQGSLVIGRSTVGKAFLYDANTLQKRALPPSLEKRSWWCFEFLDEERVAASSFADEQSYLTLANLKTGEFEQDVVMPKSAERNDYFTDVGITGNRRFALVGHQRSGVKVIDLKEGKIVARQAIFSEAQFDCHAPQGGGALFAFGQRIFALHSQTGQLKRLRDKDFYSASLTADGRQLIAVNREGALNVWDVLYFPPLDESGSDSANAGKVSIRTGGLVEKELITSVDKIPETWRRDGGVFAEIKGPGELQFPRREVTQFAMDMDITVRDALSDLLITHRAPHDRWRSEVRLAHTDPDEDGTLLRVLPVRRRGGQFFMPGHTNAPLNEKFRLTLAVGNDGLCLYVNGQRRLGQKDVQPDLHLTLAAFSDSADVTIHQIAYRPLNGAERIDLDMPGFKVTSATTATFPAQTWHALPIEVERYQADEDIDFVWEDLPAGVLSKSVLIPAGATSAVPRIYAMGNVTPGTYDVTLVGATGEFETSIPITLEITQPDAVTPLVIPTGGLGGIELLKPDAEVEAWKQDGVFAEIKGRGGMQYPRLDVDKFFLDIEMEIHQPLSEMKIKHDAPKDRWRSSIEIGHAMAQNGGVRLSPIRRRGGLHFTPGGISLPERERFVLTIMATGEKMYYFTNGIVRRGQKKVQPDLHLNFSAGSEDAHVTVYKMAYRPVSVEENAESETLPTDEETDDVEFDPEECATNSASTNDNP